MKPADLLAALKIAQPCLGGAENALPVLSHFCFMGDALYAFDDLTAILVEQETGLHCALHGPTLLGLLEASTSAQDVKVSMAEHSVGLDVGTGRVRVPMLKEQDFILKLPGDAPQFSLQLTAEVVKGFELCLLSVGKDSLQPEFMGATVAVVDGSLVFYSSDNASATRYVPQKFVTLARDFAAVLPEESISKLLRLCSSLGRGDAVTLALSARGAVVQFGGAPGVTWFSKVLQAKPEIYVKVFEGHAVGATVCELPPELAAEVMKASVLLSRESVKQCVLNFGGGRITVEANGTLGSMSTTVPCDGELTGAVCVVPEDLVRVLPYSSQIAVNNERSLLLSGGGFTHILSSRVGWKLNQAQTPKKTGDDLDDDISF